MTTFPENAASSFGSRPEGRIPPVVQVPQDHATKPPMFVENPADYIGRHRYFVERVFDITDEVTVAPLGDERWEVGLAYAPRHAAVTS